MNVSPVNSEKSLTKKNILEKEIFLTTRQLANTLGVTSRTIQQVVVGLGKDFTKSISKSSSGGRPTMLFNKAQATAIKLELQNHSKISKNGFNTLDISNDIEGELLVQRAMFYQQQKIDTLQNQLEIQKKEIENLTSDAESWRAFAEKDGTFSTTNVAKCLGIKREDVFEFLKLRGYIMRDKTRNSKRKGDYIGTALGIERGYVKNYIFTNSKTTCVHFHLTPKGMQKVQKAFCIAKPNYAEKQRIDDICREAEKGMKTFSCGKAE